MSDDLATGELIGLIHRVFAPGPRDRSLALLVDLPPAPGEDRPEWRQRRELAAGWRNRLAKARDRHGLEIALYAFHATGANNADLPPKAWTVAAGERLPASAMELGEADAAEPAVPMEEVLDRHDIFLAPTQYSATAPLKVAARRHRFRAATMPGFSAAMIPALRLDFEEVDRRVRRIAGLLDQAESAELTFRVDDGVEEQLRLDLRFRCAHVSSALLREPGQVGNLPSGEAYIVPYEGERSGEPSRSAGILPVELEGEVVRYHIVANRAVEVLSSGSVSQREATDLAQEPAYGNLAELGLGVLAGMKPASSSEELPPLEPIGSILLDEKLGLHIAFGRSDHFGGAIGPGDFGDPARVVHIDRIYLPSLQPRVAAGLVELVTEKGERIELMRDGAYTLPFD